MVTKPPILNLADTLIKPVSPKAATAVNTAYKAVAPIAAAVGIGAVAAPLASKAVSTVSNAAVNFATGDLSKAHDAIKFAGDVVSSVTTKPVSQSSALVPESVMLSELSKSTSPANSFVATGTGSTTIQVPWSIPGVKLGSDTSMVEKAKAFWKQNVWVQWIVYIFGGLFLLRQLGVLKPKRRIVRRRATRTTAKRVNTPRRSGSGSRKRVSKSDFVKRMQAGKRKAAARRRTSTRKKR